MTPQEKSLTWLGNSKDAYRQFPQGAHKELGYQLQLLQWGLTPADFKPLKTVGSGAYELRYRDEQGAYRVVYVAKYTDTIYILHTFRKTTQKTAQKDIELAQQRYKTLGGETP